MDTPTKTAKLVLTSAKPRRDRSRSGACTSINRGDWIRTSDLLLPHAAPDYVIARGQVLSEDELADQAAVPGVPQRAAAVRRTRWQQLPLPWTCNVMACIWLGVGGCGRHSTDLIPEPPTRLV